MAVKTQVPEAPEPRNLGRMLVLAALGGLGIASDHVNRIIRPNMLLKIIVRRGARVEKSARAWVRR